MAKATSQQSKYLLRIRGKQDFSLAFGQRTTLQGASDKISGNEYSLLLTSLHVCKEMYKPGVIEADVQIIKTKNAATSRQVCAGPDDAKLFENLLGARVDLTDLAYGKEGYDYAENMAKDYIFYNYEPRFENVGGITGFYVRLYAYSPDKMLTLRRYSACYTGKVLGEDILVDIVDSDKNAIAEKKSDGSGTANVPFIPLLQLDLHQLSYQSGSDTLELIQPYLVQHNETEHEFVSRVANRCGEFFFYENGALHLGCVPLKNAEGKDVAAKTIGIFRELTMPGQYAYDDTVPAWISDYTRDGVEVKDSDPQKDAKKTAQELRKKQSAEVSAEYDGPATDQVATYSYSDKCCWTDFGQRMLKNTAINVIDNYDPKSFYISRVRKFLQNDTLQEAIGQAIYEGGKKTALNLIQTGWWKNKEKEKFLDPFSYSEMKTDDYDKTTVGPYSNYAYALDGKFYSTMSQLEKDSAKTLIRVVQEADNVRPQFLGSTFVLNESDTDEYAVVKVTYDARLEADGTTRTYACVVEAVKRVSPDASKTYAHQENYVGKSKMNYEDAAKNKQFLPLPLPNTSRGKARPQAAVVFDTEDPMALNRVRIKYPWQKTVDNKEPQDPKCLKDNTKVKDRRSQRYKGGNKNLENASPWIRVTAPMAGKDYGVNFRPLKNDEVMVDYENGDMERPFVVGSLYSQSTSGPSSATTITSPAGDKIQFFENDSYALALESLLPILNTLQFIWPGMKFEGAARLGGGICMQDATAFNKMLFDTASRSITITSALGNVTLDALKGITIKAPLGKVSIEGKDIEIKAANKLTLQSGTNIKKKKFLRKDWSGLLTGMAANLEKDIKTSLALVDLDLFRCIWDALLRPVDGTLKINSARYLCLEGGKGTTSLPQDMKIKKYQEAAKYGKIKETLEFVSNQANRIIASRNEVLGCISRFDVVKGTFVALIESYQDNNNDYSYKKENQDSSKDAFLAVFRDLTFQDVLKLCRRQNGEGALLGYDVAACRTMLEKYDLQNANEENPSQCVGDFRGFRQSVLDIVTVNIASLNSLIEDAEFDVNIALGDVGDITQDTLKNALKAFRKSDVIKAVFDSNSGQFASVEISDDLKKAKRGLFYDVIQGWNTYIAYDKEYMPLCGQLPNTDKNTVVANADTWSTYLSCLYYQEPDPAKKTFKEKMVDSFFKDAQKGDRTTKYKGIEVAQFVVDDVWARSRTFCQPQFIWNPENKGGVLISDTDGNTCEIKGESVRSRSNNVDLDYIKDLCKG